MIRNFLYVVTKGLILNSSLHFKTKFSEIKKIQKKLLNQKTCNNIGLKKVNKNYEQFLHSKFSKGIDDFNIVEIFSKDFKSAY